MILRIYPQFQFLFLTNDIAKNIIHLKENMVGRPNLSSRGHYEEDDMSNSMPSLLSSDDRSDCSDMPHLIDDLRSSDEDDS